MNPITQNIINGVVTNDTINGLFEFCSSLFLAYNVVRLRKAKEVQGVSILTVAFFSLWGCWNLYYYPSIDQNFSFLGGIAVVSVNTTWVALAVWYTYRRKWLGLW